MFSDKQAYRYAAIVKQVVVVQVLPFPSLILYGNICLSVFLPLHCLSLVVVCVPSHPLPSVCAFNLVLVVCSPFLVCVILVFLSIPLYCVFLMVGRFLINGFKTMEIKALVLKPST